jgi:ribose-phosphate pyrophosphokinase
MQVISSEISKNLAAKVASVLGAEPVGVEKRVFPDGEIYVRALSPLKDRVIVIGNTHPNESLIELLMLQDLASESADVTTVIPYYGYARQDRRFREGECVAAKTMANLLELKSERIITVNLHKDYIREYFRTKVENLIPSREIAETCRDVDIVVSPDAGSFYLAEDVAEELGAEAAHFDKERISATEVNSAFDMDVRGKRILVVDDIISTGTTIEKTCNILKDRGAKVIEVACVHGLFLKSLCVRAHASDTIESRCSDYTVSGLIARALLELKDP